MAKQYPIMHKLKGFTLVELLIGVGAAGVIGALLIGFLTSNSKIFSQQNTKVNQGLELNNAYAEVDQTIKSAGAVISQYPIVGAPTYTSGLNTLVISVASINAQGNVIQDTYDYIVLYKDAQNAKIMRKRVYPDAASSRRPENTVLSVKLSKLEFRYLDASNNTTSPVQAAKIGFIINVSDNIATKAQSSSVSGQINLRND